MSTNSVITNKVATVQELAQLAIKNTYNNSDAEGKIYNRDDKKEIKIGGHYPELKLVRKVSADSGYQGYIYQNLETNKYYLVHEGSAVPGLNSETAKDYLCNVAASLASGKPQSQFNDAYNFLNDAVRDFGAKNITQIGQSLGGYHSEVFGAMDKFKDVQTITFNAVGPGTSLDAMTKFMNDHSLSLSNDFSNIRNYRYNTELVSLIAPHFGEMYTTFDYKNPINNHEKFHNMQVYTENENLTFTYDENFNTIFGYVGDAFALTILPTDLGLKLILTPNGPLNISDANEILKAISALLQGILNGEYEDTPVLKGYVSMDEILYEIKPGDTIYGICDKYDIDMEELLKLNPWLRDRMSEDGKHILIKPDEKLRLPINHTVVGENRPTFDVPFDEAAGAGTPGADPILVDLNGDGKIETTTVEDGINFDHQKDGFAEKTSWVSKEDGILAIDKNNNGIIDDGSEIFGDNYLKNDGKKATSGFDALKDLDSNNDGIISAEDSEFNNIKILKGDGSLISLEEAGIVSINLNSNSVNTIDENGNILVSQGSFVKNDGSVGNLGDFNLIVDKMMSDEVNKVEVSEDVALLPDIRSLGYVHSLHQAIMRDESGELKQLVENFIAANDETNRKELLRQILYKWTGANKVTVASGGNHYDGQKLHVIEQFVGKEFKGVNNDGHPNIWAAAFLNDCYTRIADYVYYNLMVQSYDNFKKLYNLLELEYDFESNKVVCNFDKVIEYIDNELAKDETMGIGKLLETTQIIKALGVDKKEGYEKYFEHFNSLKKEYGEILKAIDKLTINGTDEADVIEGTTGADAVFAGGGDDNIKTRQGDDLVYGGDGNDTIDTCEGDDVIYAGAGDDSILGGKGNNIIYGEDGNDTIVGGNGNDTIYGGDGDDSIKSGRGYDIIYGGLGNDTIKLDQGNATVYGGEGNDDIVVANGINLIDGGDGNDTITVNAHNTNTTIIGGLGDDYINMNVQPYSQASNIVETLCKYNLGDGNDTIYVNGFSKRQVVEFGEGITKENIIFSGKDNDIIISFRGHEGSITLKNSIGGTGIEKFILSNGEEISYEYIISHLAPMEGTEGNDSIKGSHAGETIYGLGGNDTIDGSYGNDTIYGGDGDDSIKSGRGNDIIHGGLGNDTIKLDQGNATVYGGEGNDDIVVANGINLIDGGDGNDTITVNAHNTNTTIIGGLGDDYINMNVQPYSQAGNVVETICKYNLGDGNDTIDINFTKRQILEFGEGITRDDLILSGLNNDLIITFKDHEGSITLKRFLYDMGIEKFVFSNGDEILRKNAMYGLKTYGDDNDNYLIGSTSNEAIYGYGGNDTIYAKDSNDTIYGGDGDDYIDPGNGSDIVYAGSGNDTIRFEKSDGHNPSNYIDGGDGDDYIETRNGNNTVIGGKGNDNIKGSSAKDTYIYNLGDGNDTIVTYGENDILEFGEGITRENTIFRGVGHDLLITFKDSEGSIIIKNPLYNNSFKIEKFKFANGEEFSYEYIVSHLTPTEGTEGNDSINGSYASEIIYGYGGNDTISAGNGNDIVYGGDGDDSILGSEGNDVIYGEDGNDFINPGKRNDHVYGGLGNDTIRVTEIDYQASKYIDGGEGDDEIEVREGSNTIIGGKGDDYLSSAYGGNDTYIYNFGDGNDTIENWNGDDVLQFGEGITRENTIFRGSGRDLLITFKDSEGSIRIKNPLYNPAYAIDKFKFADGEELDYKEISTSDINKIIQDMTAYNTAEDAMISYSNDINQEKELMTLVNSSI